MELYNVRNGMDSPSTDFKVYFGLDLHERLIPRLEAKRGKVYLCPACRSELFVKDGPVRAKHFCHRPSVECSLETIQHKTAKILIAQAVNDWKRGLGPQPAFVRTCLGVCGKAHRESFPDAVEIAKIELRVPSCQRILDVGLLKTGKAVFGIEVLVTHRVDEQKAGSLDIPWIEVDAEHAIQTPAELFALQYGNIACRECARIEEERRRWLLEMEAARAERLRRQKELDEERRRLEEIAEAERRRIEEGRLQREREIEEARRKEISAIAERDGLVLPAPGLYKVAERRCDGCRERILVFDWFLRPHQPPPDPRPSALQNRACALAAKSYWTNVCIRCGTTQAYREVFRSDGELAKVPLW